MIYVYERVLKHKSSSNLVSGNIKSGVKIFNVTGSLVGGLSTLSYGYTYASPRYVDVVEGGKGTVAAVANGYVSASANDSFKAISGLPTNLKYLLAGTFLWDRNNKTTYMLQQFNAYNTGKYTTSTADRIYFYKDHPDSYYRSVIIDATFSNGTLTVKEGGIRLSYGIIWFY